MARVLAVEVTGAVCAEQTGSKFNFSFTQGGLTHGVGVTQRSMTFAHSHAMYPGSDSWVILRRANILHRVSSKERFVSQLHGNSLAPNLQYTAQSSAPLFVSPDAASSVLSIPALCRLPGRGGAAPSANPQPVGASPGVDLLLSNLQDKTPSSQNIKRMV